MKHLLFAILIATAAHADTFSGFIDAAYLFNANDPANHENFVPGTGTSGKRANEFTLNLAQVQWTRATSGEQRVGYTLSLVAGEGADVVHGNEDAYRHVYQASLAYRANEKLLLEAGIFPCHIGLESFYSKDNWNYTRSWLGEFSPYFVTGVKASYAINNRWSAQLHVLNGWQIIHDNNDGKSIGTQVAYSNGPITASLNTWIGPEIPDDNATRRKFADVVVIYRINKALQIGTSIDVGEQCMECGSAAAALESGGDAAALHAHWRGIAAYARYAVDEKQALAFRAEEFRDSRNGISGAAQRLREATLTYELRPRDPLILKFETRYDRSTAPVFADDERAQFLALIGAVVTF